MSSQERTRVSAATVLFICTQLLAVYRRLCQINRQRIAERSFADNAVILYTAAKIFKGCYFRVTKNERRVKALPFYKKI